MEVNSTNNNLVSQFLARQDMPKPATNPLLNTPAKEDAFVKENSQPIEAAAVKSDDTFEKSETVEKPAEAIAPAEEIKEETKSEAPAPAEEIKDEPKEELPAQEVKDIEKTEEVEAAPAEEIKEDAQIGANVTKKVTIIDKIKGFFKNLFMKLKPNKPVNEKAHVKCCAGGGTN